MALDTFGKRLRSLRQDFEGGMSQIELRDKLRAIQVDIGETYISELERTNRMPSLEVAAGMARVFKVSLDYLGMLIIDALPLERDAPPHYFSPEADEVAQLVDAMRPEQRSALLGVARNMVSFPADRQRRAIEVKDILDSIERDLGKDARINVERVLRQQGLTATFIEPPRDTHNS